MVMKGGWDHVWPSPWDMLHYPLDFTCKARSFKSFKETNENICPKQGAPFDCGELYSCTSHALMKPVLIPIRLGLRAYISLVQLLRATNLYNSCIIVFTWKTTYAGPMFYVW